ncbi:hypothetical protein AKJ66_04205 [candidate division MSBL1 archaeon SCGC-AAA259E22]|uniref:Uncharacterized protein n=1 Tax=candidate division MSBL1 archaeon SCGC-AAA259E22 TaxID=1698265 RepID=A0A133UE80_9EURY|nr:hypothetical protein AKJ66_04205 [candidate division MSBL1 archaeon SCGC-AAA259E22]
MISDLKGEVGNRFLHAALDWLEGRGYIKSYSEGRKRCFSITEKGKEAFLNAQKLMNPYPEELIFDMNLGREESKIVVKTEGEGFDPLSAPAVYSNLRNFLPWLRLGGGIEKLTFELKEKGSSNVGIFLINLFKRCQEILQDRQLGPRFRRYTDKSSYTESELNAYQEYWREVEKRIRKKTKKGKEPDFERFLPEGLADIILEDEEVRDYIDERLDENPDWFMPHYIWTKLGFEPRCEVEKPMEANFPSVIELSRPRSLAVAASLEKKLKFLDKTRKGDMPKLLEETIPSMVKAFFEDHEDDPEFYDAWCILREKFRDKLPRISKTLDEATVKFQCGKPPKLATRLDNLLDVEGSQ